MDMNEILEQVITPDAPKVAKSRDDLGDFKFAETKDKVGLPVEHKLYVKRSCKQCYGRGYIVQTFGGYRYQACGCVNKGYVRTRKEFERKVAATQKTYPELTVEAARKMEIDALGL